MTSEAYVGLATICVNAHCFSQVGLVSLSLNTNHDHSKTSRHRVFNDTAMKSDAEILTEIFRLLSFPFNS